MSKLKAILVPDSFGWAYYFNAQGVKKYSKHDITIRPFAKQGDWRGGLTPEIIKEHDVIFIFSMWIWNHLAEAVKKEVEKKPLIMYCCGKDFSNPPECATAYAVCTERLVRKANDIGIENAVLLMEGVDTDVFKPVKLPDSDEFTIGWAGSPKQPLNRHHLLERLKYPVKTMMQRDRKFLVKNRSRQPMVDFYNSLDAYVVVMETLTGHGVGLTVLEAMACGLPVVSTDNCDVSSVLPPEWLVPMDEEECILEINQKLTMLKEDEDLRRRVGLRNLEFIRKNRSWKEGVKEWDDLFENVFKMSA